MSEKFAAFSEHWRPKVVARFNGQELKIVKVQGIFPWLRHDGVDELFLVWRGRFRVEFRDHIADFGQGNGWVSKLSQQAPRRMEDHHA